MKKTLPLLGLGVAMMVFAACNKQVAQTTDTQSAASATPAANAAQIPHDNIYVNKTSSTKGDYIADFAGKSLYVFDKDAPGVSTCSGACAVTWPPYISGAAAQKNLPANMSIIRHDDGTLQFAWKNRPLYYYAPDQNVGDTLGDGIGGVWHLAK